MWREKTGREETAGGSEAAVQTGEGRRPKPRQWPRGHRTVDGVTVPRGAALVGPAVKTPRPDTGAGSWVPFLAGELRLHAAGHGQKNTNT